MTGERKNLPALPETIDEAKRRLDGVARALQVRDPISGFLHGVGSRAATRALDHYTDETQAFTRNMHAQTEAVHSIIKFRDAVDEYRARDELAALHYENTRARQIDKIAEDDHRREIRRKGRDREHLDADRGVFNADYGLDLQRQGRDAEAERRRKERELRDLNLNAEITLTRDALGNYGGSTSNAGAHTLETVRAQLLDAYREAVASGDDSEAARINAAIDALDGRG
jgi:hypothetical protein